MGKKSKPEKRQEMIGTTCRLKTARIVTIPSSHEKERIYIPIAS
jgi:hypothetical protein